MIIGSTAMKYWFPDARKPRDLDMFHPWTLPEYTKEVETFWHPDFPDDWAYQGFANVNQLYTIKTSHAYWSLRNGSWSKHVHDMMFLKSKGAQWLPDMHDLLYEVWEDRYGKKKASISGDPADFFNSNVTRVYDHDSIHESIAYYDRPMFERVLKDGEQVAVSYKKFANLGHEDRLKLVREEVYATALERILIPNPHASPRAAYAQSLQKVITSYWRGRWATFVVLYYDELYKPDTDYFARFKDNQNKLRRLNV